MGFNSGFKGLMFCFQSLRPCVYRLSKQMTNLLLWTENIFITRWLTKEQVKSIPQSKWWCLQVCSAHSDDKKYWLYILYNLQTIQVHESFRMQGGINFQTVSSCYCSHQVKLLTHLNFPLCSCWTIIIFCFHDCRLLPWCKIFYLLGCY